MGGILVLMLQAGAQRPGSQHRIGGCPADSGVEGGRGPGSNAQATQQPPPLREGGQPAVFILLLLADSQLHPEPSGQRKLGNRVFRHPAPAAQGREHRGRKESPVP